MIEGSCARSIGMRSDSCAEFLQGIRQSLPIHAYAACVLPRPVAASCFETIQGVRAMRQHALVTTEDPGSVKSESST